MLSQVKRAERRQDWIVFLGWEPHPMNRNIDMTYLSGGDEVFGPDYGGATVFTNVREGYLKECPNVGELIDNLNFSLEMENEIMGSILDEGQQPEEAARDWLEEHVDVALKWVDGVTTFDGGDAGAALKQELGG